VGYERALNMPDTPALSVVLATPDRFAAIRKTVRFLDAQTVRDQIELVIVAPSRQRLDLEEREVEGFRAHQVVELPVMDSIGAANAAGVRAATAPIVALAEDHSFPEPGWAAALLRAHAGGYAAVGPVIRNANPATLVSWADLYVAYAPWLDPAPSGERDHLPGHNSSYKRECLLAYGDRLEGMMVSESVLHWDLGRQGHRLYLEAKAKTAHTNFSLLPPWVRSKFHSGRVFAAARVRGWPAWKRWTFAAASPLIPLVRLAKITSLARRSGQGVGRIARVIPVMILGLIASALGEAAGYAFGPGGSVEELAEYEFHRNRYLDRADAA
jgi:hypothetical protein